MARLTAWAPRLRKQKKKTSSHRKDRRAAAKTDRMRKTPNAVNSREKGKEGGRVR